MKTLKRKDQCQCHQMLKFKIAKYLGFSEVWEQYLNRYMQDRKKTTSLWIKNNTSI